MKFQTVVSVMLVMLLAIGGAAVADSLYVDGIDGAFPPFSFIDENGEADGFDVEVTRWIADEMGFEVEIVPIDWDAIIPTFAHREHRSDCFGNDNHRGSSGTGGIHRSLLDDRPGRRRA